MSDWEIKSPQEMMAIREAERQKLREAGVEPIADYQKPQPKKRKPTVMDEDNGWENADHVRRWLEMHDSIGAESYKRELDLIEMRIMHLMSAELRDLIEQRALFESAYRRNYYREWVDQND